MVTRLDRCRGSLSAELPSVRCELRSQVAAQLRARQIGMMDRVYSGNLWRKRSDKFTDVVRYVPFAFTNTPTCGHITPFD